MTFLRDSFALGNSFVEQHILKSILDGDPKDSLLWREIIQYPAARVLETMEDSPREKRRDLEESVAMILRLATEATAAMAQNSAATVIGALAAAGKALASAGDVSALDSAVEKTWEKARESGGVTAATVREMTGFYASRGAMEPCVRCIKENWRELAGDAGSFAQTMGMLQAVAQRAGYLITDVFGESDVEGRLTRGLTSSVYRATVRRGTATTGEECGEGGAAGDLCAVFEVSRRGAVGRRGRAEAVQGGVAEGVSCRRRLRWRRR